MTAKSIGVLTISQSPRADLVDPIREKLDTRGVIERGALDSLSRDAIPIPADASYPLVTTLRDGMTVTVDEDFLTPLMQRSLDQLTREGVSLILLACAGPFSGLKHTIPLINPFEISSTIIASMGINNIGVICPVEAQRDPSETKWRHAGFSPVTWAPPAAHSHRPPIDWISDKMRDAPNVECIVLDYFGYPQEYVHEVQRRSSLPVLDLGNTSIKIAAASV